MSRQLFICNRKHKYLTQEEQRQFLQTASDLDHFIDTLKLVYQVQKATEA